MARTWRPHERTVAKMSAILAIIYLILAIIYLSGAFVWALTHGVLAVDSASEARLWKKYRSGTRRHAREALHHFKVIALVPVWPIVMLLSALSLLREMQEIVRYEHDGQEDE